VFQRAVHPGEVLRDEIAAAGISSATLARLMSVPTSDVTRIINGKRQLTARMALRLGHWFRTGPEFWLNLQVQYDLAKAREESGGDVACLPTRDNPLPPPRPTGRPRKRAQGDQA